MKKFLLNSKPAEQLYAFAKVMPVFDFHCHLSPKEIYEDKPYESITQMWLAGDHYKWRVMRYAGVNEKLITGDASDFDKFLAFSEVLASLVGNPLYHWAHMELSVYFGVNAQLNAQSAKAIYEECNKIIKDKKLSPQKLIEKSNVKLVGTTDDPTDSLEYHQALSQNRNFKVVPTFRPDKAFMIDKADYLNYIELLSSVSKTQIVDFTSLLTALKSRLQFFADNGCLSTDHSIEGLQFEFLSIKELDAILQKALTNQPVSSLEADSFKLNALHYLAKEYYKHNLVMQLHIGALRNNNTMLFEKLGADIGCDSPNDFDVAMPVSKFLDSLAKTNELPKTILYNLNSKDYLPLATAACNFSKENSKGHVQLGAAWWHCDHKDGILEQLSVITSQGMLPYFVGMLTDSRSFLSFARHDYFRRILCSFIGAFIENGEYPYNESILSQMVENICFHNANQFFNREG